jgi:hypothetical protein
MSIRQQLIDAGLWDADDSRDPTESMDAAWQVVEKMHDAYRCAVVVGFVNPAAGDYAYCSIAGGWLEYATFDCTASARADTAPLAICHATLKAVGVE